MTCLDSQEVPYPFLCENCLNGQNPLYGELILAKFGNHPWWPAVIVPSFKIPKHMFDTTPNDYEFCIRFFGDYKFAWAGRSSICDYTKTEATKFLTDNPKQHEAFVEAANWYDKYRNDTADNEIRAIGELERNETSRQPPPYIKVSTVSLVAPAKLAKSMEEPCLCSCKPNDDNPCGPTSNCINRQMSIECDPKLCPSGSNCKNQCFQRKISPRVKVVFMDEQRGFGLIADEFISAGTFVIEYVGELITENELNRRRNSKQKLPGNRCFYSISYLNGLYIDAEKKGNESRFINHSCDPNCKTNKSAVKEAIRLGIFAKKNIKKVSFYDFMIVSLYTKS